MTTPPPERKSFRQRLRRAFRWCRLLVWIALLTAIGSFLFLNQVGLPGFVKKRLQAGLRAKGVDVEFERVRLRWYEGIVAEKVSLTRTNETGGPQFFVTEAKLGLDGAALWRLQLKPTSVLLRQGRIVWPLVATNQPVREMKLENLGTELRFLPNDQWELARFHATALGTKLNLSGVITNASALQHRRVMPPKATTPGESAESQLLRWLTELDKIAFTAPPEITLTLRGDAREGGGFAADLNCSATGARTPWGDARGFTLNGRVFQAAGTNSPLRAELATRFSRVLTEWGVASNTVVSLSLSQEPQRPPAWDATWSTSLGAVLSPWGEAGSAAISGRSVQGTGTPGKVATTFDLDAAALKTEWGTARQALITGRVTGVVTNLALSEGDWVAKFVAPETRWGGAKEARVTGKLTPQPADFKPQADASWAMWARLEPWRADFEIAIDGVNSPELKVEKFNLAGDWRAPVLTVKQLHTELYRGRMDGSGQLNVATRRVDVEGALDFDGHGIEPLLHPNDQRFVQQFAWQTPPKVAGRAGLTLATWTNATPSWERDILPTLWVSAKADCGPGAFRTVPWTAARTTLNISNVVITLPDLFVQRPEGTAELQHEAHLSGEFFHWKGRSGINPQIIRPLLEDEEQRQALDFFRFTTPPEISGEVWSRRSEQNRVGAVAKIVMTNFTFRGEGCSNFTTALSFTNQMIHATGLELRRGAELLTVPEVWVNVDTQTMRVTNLLSTLDPVPVMRAIGPEVFAAIAPYRFGRPPTARVNGSIMFRDAEHTDLHFEVEGGPFSWERFNMPQVRGTIHWVTNRLVITNLSGTFYGGQLEGDVAFEFAKNGEADFHFSLITTGVGLQPLVGDLTRNPTNKLEGTLSGVFNVTAANTADFKSWQGIGSVKLVDGLLWDFPLFGLFSPVLNAIVPGLGSSRAKEATATFFITNSVIRTSDLVIRSPPVRMHYDGTVEFDGQLKATIEAELFRDVFLVGPLVGLLTTPLTKVFEYKISGTLSDPQSEPLYIPKLLMIPLHPFRTLRGLFPNKDEPVKPPPKK